MFISKFSNAFGTVFLLSLIVHPFQKAEANILYHIGADFMPMLSLSWDKRMGLNIGVGASSGEDIYIGMTGPYIYTNFALKKPGVSVSVGHYGTIAGLISMRNGATFMTVQDSELGGSYIGLENSMTFSPFIGADTITPLNLVGGYYRVSGLKRFGSKGLYTNRALGMGIF